VKQVSVVRDNALDPANLAFDKSGNLIVTSMSGNGTFIPLSLTRRIPRLLYSSHGLHSRDLVLWRIYRSAIGTSTSPL